jgi:antitoxin FitA
MAQVLIRNVDDTVIAALRARAASHGLSLEAELRDVLIHAAAHPRAAIAAELASVRAMTPGGPRRFAEDLVHEGRDPR